MLVPRIDGLRECHCCGKHVPLPHRLYALDMPAGVVYVCPTTRDNIAVYRKRWAECGGEPPGSTRKHFSDFVQHIVRQLEGKK